MELNNLQFGEWLREKERDDMVSKTLLSQEDKELLDRLDENNGYV